jgi:hypothetical protein
MRPEQRSDAVLAELTTPERLVAVIDRLRDRGFRDLEAFTPYPVEDVEDALGLRRSRTPFLIFVAGLLGGGGAYGLMWLINVFLTPYDVAARPLHYPLIFVPITFEMTVLAASLTAFAAFVLLGGKLQLHYPQAEVPAFASATNDRFWVQVGDPLDDERARELAAILREAGALEVVRIGRSSP